MVGGGGLGICRLGGVFSAGQREKSLTTQESYLESDERASIGKKQVGGPWQLSASIDILPGLKGEAPRDELIGELPRSARHQAQLTRLFDVLDLQVQQLVQDLVQPADAGDNAAVRELRIFAGGDDLGDGGVPAQVLEQLQHIAGGVVGPAADQVIAVVLQDQILQSGLGLELGQQVVRADHDGQQLGLGIRAKDAPCGHVAIAEWRGLC